MHEDSGRSESDRELLGKLLNYRNLLTEKQRDAFLEMQERLNRNAKLKLSPKQRRWAEIVLEEYDPSYRNLISNRLVPSGRNIETPAVLRRENLPMKPPGRS